jgi:hypothetical protein
LYLKPDLATLNSKSGFFMPKGNPISITERKNTQALPPQTEIIHLLRLEGYML